MCSFPQIRIHWVGSEVLNITAGSEDAQVIQIQAKLRYKENTKWFNQWYNILNWRTMSKVMRFVYHTPAIYVENGGYSSVLYAILIIWS